MGFEHQVEPLIPSERPIMMLEGIENMKSDV